MLLLLISAKINQSQRTAASLKLRKFTHHISSQKLTPESDTSKNWFLKYKALNALGQQHLSDKLLCDEPHRPLRSSGAGLLVVCRGQNQTCRGSFKFLRSPPTLCSFKQDFKPACLRLLLLGWFKDVTFLCFCTSDIFKIDHIATVFYFFLKIHYLIWSFAKKLFFLILSFSYSLYIWCSFYAVWNAL